ncbi:sensor domain-containing protein [Halorubrum tebenquichense]|uniref:Two-component system sensor kinase n=1 Tax=Halorubrum tebenquichense DSM 14210 TaxID=1227485 RepID=M0DY19_9EURY|nr:sensor domain-containing protein [Halorubrum tebenquichense]ELZ38984.1 two-component system sensor kinase [Halorubrum tebenquichense DSM 14210]
MVSLRPLAALPVVGVLADGRTYRHLLYLLIAMPIGFVHSGVLSFGGTLGLVLAPVLVGVVFLLVTLVAVRLFAGFERWLADALLGTDLAKPDDLGDADGVLGGARKFVDAASTWRGLGFLMAKFWVALFGVVPLLLLARGIPLVTAPLRYPLVVQFGEVNGEPATWAIDALPEALAAVPLGVAAVLVACHLANVAGYAARRMALALLDGPTRADSAPESGGVTVESGESEAGAD